MKRMYSALAAGFAAAAVLCCAGPVRAASVPTGSAVSVTVDAPAPAVSATAVPTGASAPAPAVSAASALVMEADTGRVLFEKQAHRKSLIASTTKIMTGYLVCRTMDLSAPVTVPEAAAGIEGSSLYLQAGEVLTGRDLLYGMLLHSGNDAAAALAILCAGSEADFVAQMNQTALGLGLKDTHFANPHGLDSEENYSTAADLARLAAAALREPLFRQVVSTKTVTVAGDRVLTNHNKLLWRCPGCMGVKTGYTRAAGRILVSAARRNGRTLICVTLNAPDDWKDHCALYDWAFGED